MSRYVASPMTITRLIALLLINHIAHSHNSQKINLCFPTFTTNRFVNVRFASVKKKFFSLGSPCSDSWFSQIPCLFFKTSLPGFFEFSRFFTAFLNELSLCFPRFSQDLISSSTTFQKDISRHISPPKNKTIQKLHNSL